MLGWMLKRGENASDAVDDAGDTAQIDQPDTPAPVFAARAFKSALFGSPRRTDPQPSKTAQQKIAGSSDEKYSETPLKPAGILLTPGTGATRRKKVSFGYDVAKQKESTTRSSDDANKKQRNAKTTTDKPSGEVPARESGEQDEWEEEEDSDEAFHDVTIDLNEPHSESGKFWKQEYEKYHKDARIELERLLKYKKLAKSFAEQRDAETLELAERLRDEQIKVLKMEKVIAENTRNIESAKQTEKSKETMELSDKLASQTVLVTEYREQVRRLESDLEEALRSRDQRLEGQRRRRQGSASPATHKALTETQRELRQAKSQLREMGALRDQVASLELKLQAARQAAQGRAEDLSETSRTKELRAQVHRLKEEATKRDQEILVVRAEFDAFRAEAKTRDDEVCEILKRAQSKIASLSRENKMLKQAQAKKSRSRSWHVEDNGAASIDPVDVDNAGMMSEEARQSPNGEERKRRHLAAKERRARSLREEFREDAGAAPSRKSNSPRRTHGTRGVYEDGDSEPDEAIDLLRNRFARLGGPESDSRDFGVAVPKGVVGSVAVPKGVVGSITVPKGINLPPERRAAVLARIEKRMAENKRTRAQNPDREYNRPGR